MPFLGLNLKCSLVCCLAGISFILVFLQLSDVRADSLSDAYGRARDIVRSFRDQRRVSDPPGTDDPVAAPTSPSVNDVTWSPSFGTSPTQVQQPTPQEVAIKREIEKRERMIGKLSRGREVWRVALERLNSGGNWQRELQYWVEDSQTAQLGAIYASVSLLVGTAGPVATAVDAHRHNAAVYWNAAQKARARLEDINLKLIERVRSGASSGASRGAADALKAAFENMASRMKSEASLAELLKNLDTVADAFLKCVPLIEGVKEARQKHDLLLALKSMQDVVIDLVKDVALDLTQGELVRRSLPGAAHVSRIANFVIDYGYHSTRFYVAWANVDDILGQIDNQNELATTIQRRITESTNQIQSLRQEKQQIETARGDREQERRVLVEVRQQELTEAYRMGEWFSQQAGIRAPGEPILPRD